MLGPDNVELLRKSNQSLNMQCVCVCRTFCDIAVTEAGFSTSLLGEHAETNPSYYKLLLLCAGHQQIDYCEVVASLLSLLHVFCAALLIT